MPAFKVMMELLIIGDLVFLRELCLIWRGSDRKMGFSKNVLYDDEVTCYLRPLHEMLMSGTSDFGKEENLLFQISVLIQKYGQPFENCVPERPQEIERASV